MAIEVVDPHFHFFDLREGRRSGQDPKVLEAPDQLYGHVAYGQEQGALPAPLRHTGGVFVEAVSVCHRGLSGPSYSAQCLLEASYGLQEVAKATGSYVVVAACALEQPETRRGRVVGGS